MMVDISLVTEAIVVISKEMEIGYFQNEYLNNY